MADENTLELLAKAKKAPQSKSAAQLLSKVLQFLNVAGRKLDYSSFRRRSCLTEMIAHMRARGPPGQFISVSPHDIHDLTALRYSLPFRGYSLFPASLANNCANLHSNMRTKTTRPESSVFTDDDRCTVNVSEAALHRTIGNNPVAATLSFNKVVQGLFQHLLAAPKLKHTVPYEKRPRGVFGITSAFTYVVESAQRLSLHIHGHVYNGFPMLLSHVCHDAALHSKAMKALNSHVRGHIPVEYHLLNIVARVTGAGHRRDSAQDAPSPRDNEQYWQHVYFTVASKNTHQHTSSCVKYKRGSSGCRYAKPSGHCLSETKCVELHESDGDTHQTAVDSLRCPYCYTRNGRTVQQEDALRSITFDSGSPTRLPEEDICGLDTRCLCVELQRPVLLPQAAFDGEASTLIADAVNKGCPLTFPETREGNADLRRLTNDVCTHGSLIQTLLRQCHLLGPLQALADVAHASLTLPVETARLRPLRRIWKHWSDVTRLCDNGNIAAYNHALSACTGSNAVPLQLGVGGGATHTACYQSPYMTKESDAVVAGASVLVEAAKRCKDSVAADAGAPGRDMRKTIQYMLNHMKVPVELGAMQAAQVCLGYKPDGNSHPTKFVHGHDCKKLALFASSVSSPGKILIQFSAASKPKCSSEDMATGPASETEVDFLTRLDGDDNVEPCGKCQIYTNHEKNKIPVSDVTHYAHRSRRLANFSAYEFFSIFVIAPITRSAEKEWLKEYVQDPSAMVMCRFWRLYQQRKTGTPSISQILSVASSVFVARYRKSFTFKKNHSCFAVNDANLLSLLSSKQGQATNIQWKTVWALRTSMAASFALNPFFATSRSVRYRSVVWKAPSKTQFTASIGICGILHGQLCPVVS